MSAPVDPKIVADLQSIPEDIKNRSGAVFYSSRAAFVRASPLYVLGLNPGGCPEQQAANTVGRHIDTWLKEGAPYSAYIDESWEEKQPGQHGMQPRIRHMFDQLGIDLQLAPASNVVFIRTRGEADLAQEKSTLLKACWPVHQAVLEVLDVQVVICLGQTAGQWVRDAIGAHLLFDEFHETYTNRHWSSSAHRADDGRIVISLTHPGRTDWCNANADPTPMVARVLSKAAQERAYRQPSATR